MPALNLHIASRWHPAESLLGRLVRRGVGDPVRAEAQYLLILTLAMAAWMLAQVFVWLLLGEAVLARPTGAAAVLFWFGQVATGALLLGVGLVGFTPATQVLLEGNRLTVVQGPRALTLERDEVRRWTVVSARVAHRHFRRYRRARLFPGSAHHSFLMLYTADGPMGLALSDGDRQRLVDGWGLDADSRVPERIAVPDLAA